MRFMHIADLHLGKRLNETDMTADIEHALFSEILGRIFSEVSEEKPIDALLIAGDIYDKSLPSADAEEMFGSLLTAAVKLGMRVYCVSGNHDSARRIAANEKLLSQLGIYIAREFSPEAPVRVEQLGDFDIAMLPFIAPSDVRQVYPDEEIPDITSAVRTVLSHAGLPGARPCILVAHQAVGECSDRLVGMQQCADGSVFEGFAYTALGHIHTPMNVGERVRYCGSPVCYSGSEAKEPQKYVDIIDVEPGGELSVQHREIRPLHGFRVLDDSFSRLMSEEYPAVEDYCYITVSDFDGVIGAAAQLRGKFPNMLSLKYRNKDGGADETEEPEDGESWSFGDEFSRFYRRVTKNDPEEELLKRAEYIYELTERAFAQGTVNDLLSQPPQLCEKDTLKSGGESDDN